MHMTTTEIFLIAMVIIFTIPLLVDGASDHPMPIINHIDQESRQIQAGELGGNLVLGKGSHERIEKIPS